MKKDKNFRKKEYLEYLRKNNIKMYNEEVKTYPRICEECDAIITTSDDNAGDLNLCYDCI